MRGWMGSLPASLPTLGPLESVFGLGKGAGIQG